jgi:hypothetical protein
VQKTTVQNNTQRKKERKKERKKTLKTVVSVNILRVFRFSQCEHFSGSHTMQENGFVATLYSDDEMHFLCSVKITEITLVCIIVFLSLSFKHTWIILLMGKTAMQIR